MASLSGKQQKNIEAKWKLDEELDKTLIWIADTIREMVKYRAELKRGVYELEDQVPDSVQDAWDREDEAHSVVVAHNHPNAARDREARREAYDLIKSVLR
tara:strand:+ start:186 stop:485 length:300 start_codon:yes stop_codon:yes gene_type:complete